MISVSAGHIILTPTQPVGSGRPQRESNPGPPHQELGALQNEVPRGRYGTKVSKTLLGRQNHKKKKTVSARPTENRKERKGKTKLLQTMVKLDIIPITILNKFKPKKAHTHTQGDLEEHPH